MCLTPSNPQQSSLLPPRDSDAWAALESAVAFVRGRWQARPRAAVVLGSGLGPIAGKLDVEQTLDYGEVPFFPRTTAMGHRGRVVCGRLAELPVIAFQGRFHLYEGYTPQQAALPVRLAWALGAELLVVANAAGGVHPQYRVGDLMQIDDHINFMFANPLVGLSDPRWGPRFPEMSMAYDRQLQSTAQTIARQQQIVMHQGVYLGLLGPTYETRAEYRMVRRLGGDAVGMSTVPEVIAARQVGLRVLGLSAITNLGVPDGLTKTTGHDVIAAASAASSQLGTIVEGVLQAQS